MKGMRIKIQKKKTQILDMQWMNRIKDTWKQALMALKSKSKIDSSRMRKD